MQPSTLHSDPALELRAELELARARTDAIFRCVADSTLYDRPIRERHRLVFYLGHLEAFDWNLLGRGLRAVGSVHPELDRLFAFGIDPVDRALPADAASDWPRVEEVRAYVRRARRAVDGAIDAARRDRKLGRGNESTRSIEMLIEHRLMHAETLTYLLHQLPVSALRPRAAARETEPPQPARATAPRRPISIPAGPVRLGRSRDAESFGWDNEFEAETIWVPEFAIDSHPVTNGKYLEFVRAGGYEDRWLWSGDDWNWRESAGLEHPHYWRRYGRRWLYRTLLAEIPLPLEWPVYVSHAEASAFARWCKRSLPSEAQWQRAAYGAPDARRSFPWGEGPPKPNRGNFDFRRADPTPVDAHPAGASELGVEDLLGNGWEWTSTAFAPLCGFEPSPLYPGYSSDFFDGKHFVMKGGSPRTASRLLRRSFRNWFQPHFPYAYATFRCIDR